MRWVTMSLRGVVAASATVVVFVCASGGSADAQAADDPCIDTTSSTTAPDTTIDGGSTTSSTAATDATTTSSTGPSATTTLAGRVLPVAIDPRDPAGSSIGSRNGGLGATVEAFDTALPRTGADLDPWFAAGAVLTIGGVGVVSSARRKHLVVASFVVVGTAGALVLGLGMRPAGAAVCEPAPVVPEVPMLWLLPLGATAACATVVVHRARRGARP